MLSNVDRLGGVLCVKKITKNLRILHQEIVLVNTNQRNTDGVRATKMDVSAKQDGKNRL